MDTLVLVTATAVAASAPKAEWIGLLTAVMLAATAITSLINAYMARKAAKDTGVKLDEIHFLVDGNLSKVRERLDQAMALIERREDETRKATLLASDNAAAAAAAARSDTPPARGRVR